VQVEQKLNPELRGKPVVVVQVLAAFHLLHMFILDGQYNAYKGGSIIAVGYEARKEGVKRGTSSEQAKLVCPALCVARVPEAHGKANLTRYREAGAEVVKVCHLRAVFFLSFFF
jgi:DNA polymerase eta